MIPNCIMPTFSSGVSQRKPHIVEEKMPPLDLPSPPSSSLTNEIDSCPNMHISIVD